jgi:peptidyl-Lys metalloendopeptidase
MFLSTVRVALGGLAFFAAAEVVAVPSLSLRVSGPQSVEGVENLKLVTTVTNTGNETLKLLKDPNGPLSKIQTRTFDIRDATGKQPRFTGTKLKYIPSMAALLEGEDYFTVLSPGESLDVEHDCMSL